MDSEQLIRGKTTLRTVGHREDLISLDDSVREIELYRYLNAAPDIENLVFRAQHLLKKIDITDFAHLNCNSIADGLDPFGSHDQHVTEQYVKEGFHQDDLATRHLLTNETPIFRSTICKYVESAPFDNEIFRRHKLSTKFMHSHGLIDVYNFILKTNDGRVLFSVYSNMCEPEKFQKIVNANIKQIHALGDMIDKVGNKKFRKKFHNPKCRPYIPIPPRPLQLLETLAQKDLTLNEAAEVLNISISTANQHIAAAKKSLNAHTTHGLVLAAQREGLILVER